MKTKLIIAALLPAVIAGLAVLWPDSSCDAKTGSCETNTSQTKSKVTAINQEVAAEKALLIDVREPHEYAAGHAAEAVNIPLGDIEAGKLKEADKEKKSYVYCRSGRRAEAAKEALTHQGYKKIENLGGLSDWEDMGGSVTR